MSGTARTTDRGIDPDTHAPDLPESPTSLSMDVGVDTHDFVRGTMTKSLPAAFSNLSYRHLVLPCLAPIFG